MVIKSHFWNSNNDEGIKEKYKLTDTYTQSESFIPKENNYLDDKEYKNLKCYFEDLKYYYRKIKLNNI